METSEITLDWDYDKQKVNMPISGYRSKAFVRLGHRMRQKSITSCINTLTSVFSTPMCGLGTFA